MTLITLLMTECEHALQHLFPLYKVEFYGEAAGMLIACSSCSADLETTLTSLLTVFPDKCVNVDNDQTGFFRTEGRTKAFCSYLSTYITLFSASDFVEKKKNACGNVI